MAMKAVASWRWILIVATLPLLVSGALFHIPVTLMALLGAAYVVRSDRALWSDPGIRLIFLTFLCLWLPQLLALPDAVSPRRGLVAATVYLSYPLACIFIVHHLRTSSRWIQVVAGVALVTSIWALDVIVSSSGFVEWTLDRDDPRYIEGTLFSRFLVGHVAAVVSPLSFELVRRRRRAHPWLWILPIAVTALVLLSGRRVAWLMLIFGAVAYMTYLVPRRKLRPGRLAVAALLPLVAGVLLYFSHEGTRERFQLTAGMFSTDVNVVDTAISWRLDIWKTAVDVIEDNWINGIGQRGFREAYAEYADPDNFWLQGHLDGAYHPHLFLLEVAAETGLLGLIGYGLALWLLWSALHNSPKGPNGWARPCGIAVMIAVFPLNSHAAMYGAYWSAVTWWLIGLFAAATSRLPDEPASHSARIGPELLRTSERLSST